MLSFVTRGHWRDSEEEGTSVVSGLCLPRLTATIQVTFPKEVDLGCFCNRVTLVVPLIIGFCQHLMGELQGKYQRLALP
jgi:hypothetical protein